MAWDDQNALGSPSALRRESGQKPVVAGRNGAIWAQDPDMQRWVSPTGGTLGLVDATGTDGLLAQVDGRVSAAVFKWLNAQPETSRTGIPQVATTCRPPSLARTRGPTRRRAGGRAVRWIPARQ